MNIVAFQVRQRVTKPEADDVAALHVQVDHPPFEHLVQVLQCLPITGVLAGPLVDHQNSADAESGTTRANKVGNDLAWVHAIGEIEVGEDEIKRVVTPAQKIIRVVARDMHMTGVRQLEVGAGDLMPVNTPVQVSLEISDPGEEAVNYTLSFR